MYRFGALIWIKPPCVSTFIFRNLFDIFLGSYTLSSGLSMERQIIKHILICVSKINQNPYWFGTTTPLSLILNYNTTNRNAF